MNSIRYFTNRGLGLAVLLVIGVSPVFAQQGAGMLRGQISDDFGGVIIGAAVTVTGANGVQKSAVTNEEGNYTIGGLAPGRYTVRASTLGFAPYEKADVQVQAARSQQLDIRLSVMLEKEEVTVASESPLGSESNADAIVLRGKDLDALPDDPEDLAASLQALAGPSAGPNGGQIYIDGFTGGRLPPKESIREVRVNQNPFNAENDRPGFGRIDILTRPGMDKLRGSAFYSFNDESLNSRNPLALSRADFQTRLYGLTLSGPVLSKKASFFIDFQRREEDDNDLINATILDSAFVPTPFVAAVLTPRRFVTFSPRFDYALNQDHTFVGRYTYTRSTNFTGVGGFNLLERAFDTANTEHSFQLTETAVINPKVINETRFQFIRSRNERESENALSTINVLEAFTGGGSGVGFGFNDEDRWELQNYTTSTAGRHVLRFGVRLRGVRITDMSPQNFGGTFTFAGATAPQLDVNNQVVRDASGALVLTPITSIERYRRTLLFQQQGFSPAQIRAIGGGASQFSISGGNPEAKVSQVDFGGFFQDELRLRPNLSLTFGLRYETQSNIKSRFNLGPRVFFAWAPGGTSTGTMGGPFGGGGSSQPALVIRGGVGVFYDRFNENGTLQAERFNGFNQLRFNIIDPAILDQFPNVPSVETLSGLALPQVTNRVADDLQAPYSIVTAIQFEKQLPYKFTVYGGLFNNRNRHTLRLRNVNAPLPGTFDPRVPGSGQRPLGNAFGDIYEYESTGRFNLTQMFVGVRNQLSRNFSIFANYGTGVAKSDTDCIFGNLGSCFPANSYDLRNEYGRVAFFPRHRLFMAGTIGIPKLNIALNPFIIATTGRFYNITTGRDTNGDRLFTERPAFATENTRAVDLRRTTLGDFDLNPAPGQELIPRNFGEGPGLFSVNLGISRTFGFGEIPGRGGAAVASAAAASSPSAGGSPQGRGGSGGPGGPRGGSDGGQRGGGAPGGPPGVGPGGGPEKRYNVTFSVNIQNLLNSTNLDTPVGNLSSPRFGQSLRTAGAFGFGPGGGGGQNGGNRRVTAQLRFNF